MKSVGQPSEQCVAAGQGSAAALPRAVYVHVPFCVYRCGYCDFTLVANRDSLIPDYLRALQHELQAARDEYLPGGSPAQRLPVDTIFIGGGTPTHLSPAQLQRLLQLVDGLFCLSPGGEYSVEANPDGLTDDKLNVLQAAGVNRVSLGVQSFDAACLTTLERRHSAEEAVAAAERCHRQFPNVSLDLIFAVPGQSAEVWQSTLRTAGSLPVQHISTYGLTYEHGTAFSRREQRGQLRRTPDETEREMYLQAIDQLSAAGFEHYEVSNFARPGFRCRHNQTYWHADEYFAFGPGAARYVQGVRTTSCRSVGRWISAWLQHRPCVQEQEQLSPVDRAREAVMLALRLRDGLQLSRFQQRFGWSVEELAGEALRRYLQQGLLEVAGDRLRLTRDGLLLADSVVVDFL